MKKLISLILITRRYLKQYIRFPNIPAGVRSRWAREALAILDFEIRVNGPEASKGPVIFVANHISYMDIPLLMATLEDCVFVSKKEVAAWPLFGTAAKKTGTVFVDRSSKDSRRKVREEIENQLIQNQKKIVVFPSGTTSLSRENHWRKGVFEIAKALDVPIQPIRLSYSRGREVAYIGQDFFPLHLLKLTGLNSVKAHVEIHRPIVVRNLVWDLEYCRRWCTMKAPAQELGQNLPSSILLTEA